MSRAHRKRALLIGLLGVTVTLLVEILELHGGLTRIEEQLYDRRAYYCQHFGMVAPTKKLIHLDMDDAALDVIGKWPWPRQKIAQVVDELHDAGAKVLFMDIIFPDIERDMNGTARTEGDAALSQAIARFGHVLTPVSLQLAETQEFTPLGRRMIGEMSANLELDKHGLLERIADAAKLDKTLRPENVTMESAVSERFDATRQEAMYDRVAELMEQRGADFSTIRKALLPHVDPMVTSSTLIDLLKEQYDRVLKDREMQRFKLKSPAGLDLAVSRHETEQIPVVPISHAAAYSGFVDPFSVGDKKVRSVVLGVQSRGALLPHASLALSCAMLDVNIKDVSFEQDKVVLPLPSGKKLNIPVRTAMNDAGQPVPLVFDIPWWGGDEWKTMYDYHEDRRQPNYQLDVQHDSVVLVGEVLRQKQIIEYNESELRTAMKRLVPLIEQDKVKIVIGTAEVDKQNLQELLANSADRISQAEGYLDLVKDAKPEDLPPENRDLMKSLPSALRDVKASLFRLKEAQPILADAKAKLAAKVRDRAVLMGWTATAAFDFYPTPLHDRCPGVVALGAVFNGITTGRMLQNVPQQWTTMLTVLLGFTTTALVALFAPITAAVGTMALAIAYLLINGFVIYDYEHKIMGLAGPMMAIVPTWMLLTITKFTAEMREKAQIRKRFQTYIDPKLVNFSIEHPDQAKFDGQIQEMTVVFTDLEGFTTLSEALKEKTVPMLSEYMGEMVPIIRANNGYVNKFLGDGIMFFFNAPVSPDPNHASNAVKAILDMQHAMIGFNDQLKARGLPTLNMRAGMVTGEMVVGDAGPSSASDYTVLGDNVNLASRLEGANKATGTNTMIHWRTRELLGEEFICRPIGRLQVKGKTEGVMTFEPLGPAGSITEQQRKMAEMSRKIVDAYIAGKFDECIAAVAEMEKELGESKFTKLYHQEAQQRKEEFAWKDVAEFNGVITLHDK